MSTWTYVLPILGSFAVLAAVVGWFLLGGEPRSFTLQEFVGGIGDVIKRHPRLVGILILVLVVHRIMVDFLDAIATRWILAVTHVDFTALVYGVEGDAVLRVAGLHWYPFTAFAVLFYLVFHAFFLLFAPLYIGATQEDDVVKTALFTYPVIYLIALPFMLFFPSDNPMVYLHLANPMNQVIPGISQLYYQFTTVNNTLPSLHVALAVSIALLAWRTPNRRFRWLATVYAALIVFIVLYLPIHWVSDVVTGLVLAVVGVRIATVLARSPQVDDALHPAVDRSRSRAWSLFDRK